MKSSFAYATYLDDRLFWNLLCPRSNVVIKISGVLTPFIQNVGCAGLLLSRFNQVTYYWNAVLPSVLNQYVSGCIAAGFTRCCAFGACRVDLPDGGHCFCDRECLNHYSYPSHNCCSDNPCEGNSKVVNVKVLLPVSIKLPDFSH